MTRGSAKLCTMSLSMSGFDKYRESMYLLEILIPGGLAVTGVILADQVKSLDWRARKVEKICTLPTVAEILGKLKTLLQR